MPGLLETRLRLVFSGEAEIVATWPSPGRPGLWEMLAHIEPYEIHLVAGLDALGRWRTFHEISASLLP